MKQILVYADSLSWGIVPGTRSRLPFEQRWPGVLENRLAECGLRTRVIEDCLNGRRTVWDDPFKPGRNGRTGIEQRIEINSPLALVVLMLGTNDFQVTHNNDAWMSAQGIASLVVAIRAAPIEPGMPVPPIMIMVPPLPSEPRGTIAPKFLGAEAKCVGLADAYRQVADTLGCAYFDANSVTQPSRVDGVHLDADQHTAVGLAIADIVRSMLD